MWGKTVRRSRQVRVKPEDAGFNSHMHKIQHASLPKPHFLSTKAGWKSYLVEAYRLIEILKISSQICYIWYMIVQLIV